jgi:hypothetical protein
MASYGADLLQTLCATGETGILMLDQSKLVDGVECLMLSIRVGERALPWLWTVVETGGGIGFDVAKKCVFLVYNGLEDTDACLTLWASSLHAMAII